MCGITGFFSAKHSIEELQTQITKMCSVLTHRGPDGWGRYVGDGIALGHTRLSIVDVFHGDQPMMTNRYVIVFNGEIYNHIELRAELEAKGSTFKTVHSDTEVILKAFEMYGTDSFAMLNGQFAFLLWDKVEKRMFAVRDRYGIRPLYYLKHNNSYYFTSEMKALDCIPGYSRSFNTATLFEHALLWNTIGSETVYNNIVSVPGGTYYLFKLREAPVAKIYYSFGAETNPYRRDYVSAKEEFYDLLTDAVRLRLRSDVPVGAYVSGGIDSSVIASLVKNINSSTMKTFSIVFDDSAYDEREFQQQMVRYINSKHQIVSISYDTINEYFMNAVYHAERPLFRTAPVPLYLLSETVRDNGIKVVLTGEGADEVLFGYDSFKELKLLEFWKRQPASRFRPLLIRRLYPHLKHYADQQQYGLMKMYYEGFLEEYDNVLSSVNIRMNNNMVIKHYIRKDYRICIDKEDLLQKYRETLPEGFERWSLLQRNQYAEMRTLLAGYLLSSQGDRMSLSHSVEGRYPFLDHRLVEFLFSLPDTFKLNGFSQKHLLRDSFRGRIPDSIIDRPKLPYQAPDLKSFVRNEGVTELTAEFLSEKMIHGYGVFDTKAVKRFMRKVTSTPRDQVGYRDNMLMTFILSTQIAGYWMRNPKTGTLDNAKKTIDIIDMGQ